MPFLFVNSSFPVVATKMFQTESVWGCLELVGFTNKFQVSGLHVSLGLAHDPAAAAEFGVVAITEVRRCHHTGVNGIVIFAGNDAY